MKLNRRRGATLGLVAVAVLVIIVLGVGFFILSQILGGGREVANATDAGVLNVARRALSPTLIQVPITADSDTNPQHDFLGVGVNDAGVSNSGTGSSDGSHNRISMLALNRIVAQSIIVACNAQDLRTTAASTHARDVVAAAKNISTSLKNLIEGSTSPLPTQFSNVAQANNTKMFQGNKVQLTGLQSTFLRPGLSTNVYVSPNLEGAIPVGLPSSLKNSRANALRHDLAGQEQYIAGYVPFTIDVGGGAPIDIAGVPIFPKQKPHLVDTGEYNSGTPIGGAAYLPPNAFRANSTTQDNNSGGFGGAVACALVGALDQDFAASVPRGYIRIRNGVDASIDHSGIVTQPVVDAGTDIFNNELWGPAGGVDVGHDSGGNPSVYALSSSPAAQDYMQQWIAYNAAPGSTPRPATEPVGSLPGNIPASLSGKLNVTIDTGTGFRAATVPDMEALRSATRDCEAQTGWDRPGCNFGGGAGNAALGTTIAALINQTGANQNTNMVNPSSGYTAIEVQKHDLLSHRFGSGKCAGVVRINGTDAGAGGKPYGMKKFNVGNGYCTPGASVAFGEPGSPLDYIVQIGGPGTTHGCENTIIQKIHDRIKQVDPQITVGQVRTALGSNPSLDLGESLYLYCPGPNSVALVEGGAGTYFRAADGPTGLATDGTGSPSTSIVGPYSCQNDYSLEDTVVNSKVGEPGTTCGSHGDAGFHQQPYTEGPHLPALDKAVWTPASGWRNLLGEIHFQNEANGAGQFCKPN